MVKSLGDMYVDAVGATFVRDALQAYARTRM